MAVGVFVPNNLWMKARIARKSYTPRTSVPIIKPAQPADTSLKLSGKIGAYLE